MNIAKNINTLRVIAEDSRVFAYARLAAGIFYRNQLVSIGVNSDKTHPFAMEYAKNQNAIFLHAETAAILKAKKKLTEKEFSKSTLIVVRIKFDVPAKTNLMFGLAKPCEGCYKCIRDHKLRSVIYTNNCTPGVLEYTTMEFHT